MNKARLVKKVELEQAQARQAQKETAHKPVSVENVRRWVKEKCSPEQLSPRQKFAALFTPPPRTDWVSK